MMASRQAKSELERKRNLVDTLYHHSDLSVESISYQADMSMKKVQGMVDKIRKKEALEVLVEQSKTSVEKIMTRDVVSLEHDKTLHDCSVSMTRNRVGCLVVTKKGKPFGIVTKGDLVRAISTGISFRKVSLEKFATRPLVYASPSQPVEDVSNLMVQNKIRKLPVLHDGRLAGIITATDLAMFLSPTRRPGLTESILHVITRENSRKRS